MQYTRPLMCENVNKSHIILPVKLIGIKMLGVKRMTTSTVAANLNMNY